MPTEIVYSLQKYQIYQIPLVFKKLIFFFKINFAQQLTAKKAVNKQHRLPLKHTIEKTGEFTFLD